VKAHDKVPEIREYRALTFWNESHLRADFDSRCTCSGQVIRPTPIPEHGDLPEAADINRLVSIVARKIRGRTGFVPLGIRKAGGIDKLR